MTLLYNTIYNMHIYYTYIYIHTHTHIYTHTHTCCILFVHFLSVSGHFCCLHFVVIVNKAAINMGVQISILDSDCISLGHVLRSGIVLSYGNSIKIDNKGYCLYCL